MRDYLEIFKRNLLSPIVIAIALLAGALIYVHEYRDAWFIGFTGNYITGVWMGNDDGTPMNKITGGRYPAQLWRSYMEEVINFSTPVFVPEAAQPLVPADSEFSNMLNRWSTVSVSRFEGSDAPPVYNR